MAVVYPGTVLTNGIEADNGGSPATAPVVTYSSLQRFRPASAPYAAALDFVRVLDSEIVAWGGLRWWGPRGKWGCASWGLMV